MDKEKYINIINKIQYSNNLKEKTIYKINSEINKISLNGKLKIIISLFIMEMYLWSYGAAMCA